MKISYNFNDIFLKLSHSEQKENRNLNCYRNEYREEETFMETKR